MSIGSITQHHSNFQSTRLAYLEERYINSKNTTDDGPERTDEQDSAKLGSSAASDATYAKPTSVQAIPDINSSEKTQAASTILSFIGAQMGRDIADGASQAELQSRLESGLEGFMQGFGEAYEQLSALGSLVPGVKEAIEQTFIDVLDGVSDMAERLGLGNPVTDEIRAKFGVLEEANPNIDEVTIVDEAVPADFSSYSASVNESRSFSFSLKTQDGDLINIKAQSHSSAYINKLQVYQESGSGSSLRDALNAGIVESGGFLISIEGELDEKEVSAISDLLSQINDLSEDFFAGDIEQAYKEALEIGFNDEEILQFSLRLERQQQVSVSREDTVSTVRDLAEKALHEDNNHRMEHLSRFIESVENIRNSHDGFRLAESDDTKKGNDASKPDFVSFINNMTDRLLERANRSEES
ncbi:MAG: hypothetical protein ACI93R_002841 [Flavobacteriales bacterium]|jgi:hypothetical protein